MSTAMRAKMYVTSVTQHKNADDQVVQETVAFSAVGKSEPYDANGSDENNTFAKYTPSASASFAIMNPALLGKYSQGDTFYVDFTPAT